MRNRYKLNKLISLLLSGVIIFTVLAGCSEESSLPVDNSSVESVGDQHWNDSETDIFQNRAKITRGFTLTAGTDYSATDDYQTACNEITKIFDTMKASYFNSVFINMMHQNKSVFKSNVLEYFTAYEQDIADFIYNTALDKGFYIYFVFDVKQFAPVNTVNPNTEFINIVGNLVNKYPYLSGVMYSGYEPVFTDDIYKDYIISGSLSGVNHHKYKVTTEYVSNLINSTKIFSKNIFVGVMFDSDPVTIGNRIKISNYCHLPYWLSENKVDFSCVKTTFKNTSLDDFCSLWSNIDTFAQRYVELNATDSSFFDNYKKITENSFNGIIVNDINSLIKNAETLNKINEIDSKVFGGVSENNRNTILKIYAPSEATVTTDEKFYYIKGASDPLKPVLINGEEIDRDINGNFSYKVNLADGENKFTVTHKEFTEEFTIKHRFNIMRSVSPTNSTRLNGSSKLIVSAICIKGAVVTATLNGQTINLTAANDTSESSYVSYSGVFMLPASTTQQQNLGKVTFKATYNGNQASKSGSVIYINAISGDTPVIDEQFNFKNESGKVGYILQIEREQAETFNGYTSDNRSRCINAYLPKGTVDYCESSDSVVSDSGGTYYYRQMNYGKRVYSRTESYRGIKTDYIKLFYGSLPDYNTMSVAALENNGRHTYITLNTEWKAPFNVTLAPQEYIGVNLSPAEYEVSSTTYEYIDFSFSYCTNASGSIEFTDDPVFSRGEWIKQSNGEYTLRLYLKRKGMFYGWSASYNSNGQLVLGFLNPVKITTAKNSYGYSLENTVIMLDAGHGGKGDSGATGFAKSKEQYECALNLILANKVKTILEDLGATVIMTRTEDVNVTLDVRNSLARQYKPDIFISFHRNGSTSASRKGYSTYYYNPFSMQLAKEISTKCDALRSCGTKLLNYSPPMQVCRISECPSILTENWFMTNADDFNLIITDDFNNKNAEATVKGIIEYFKYIQ